MKCLFLLIAVLIGVPAAASGTAPGLAGAPEIRITVKTESEGTDRKKDGSSVASRRLNIHIENREHKALPGLQLQWKITSKDIRSHKIAIAAHGKKDIALAADEIVDVRSDVAQFAHHEGKPKQTGKGRNKRTVVEADSGTDYAGYVVEILRNGKLVAEASTVGMQVATKGMRVK